MNTYLRTLKYTLLTGALLATGSTFAVDWSGVPSTNVPVYYPGQTGMEWILSKRDHDGAARYKKRKKPCLECHLGDEVSFGANQVKGKTDTAPYPGRRPSEIIATQAAYDANNFYIRLSWPKTAAAGKKMDDKFDTKVTVMLDDGGVEEFAQGGCWVVCHQDSTEMPAASGQEIQKYLGASRNKIKKKVGGGTNYKADGDINAMMAAGEYLEYWQAQLNPGQAATFIDGTILKERVENKSALVSGSAKEEGNNWVVEFVRPLAGDSEHKTLSEGKTYNLGIALHDQNSAGRFHIVSLEYTMALGGDALIKAVKK
jgi:cytochrome c-type protein NapC